MKTGEMSWCYAVTAIVSFVSLCGADQKYSITIYPHFHEQNGRSYFETDRWNGHNGLDAKQFIAGNKAIGSRTGRWIKADDGVFQNATEDPNRTGYPDPNYFRRQDVLDFLGGKFLYDFMGYGENLTLVLMTKSQFWPSWMNTSLHNGIFPNNLDAGAEMSLLLLEALHNYTGGVLPPYYEVMNEPETTYKYIEWNIVIEYHKIVAQKVHAKFPNLKILGPTNDGYMEYSDFDNFKYWKNDRDFMNMSLNYMDIYSFHPYNAFYSQPGKHNFTGSNEERLNAYIDLVESYAVQMRGKTVPLITSEYGLGRRYIDSQTSPDLVKWAYAFMHNGHMFTFLNHRGVMEKAVAFLISLAIEEFENASLFYSNGTETYVAKVYKFWNYFNDSHRFLKVGSEFNGGVRMVSPLVVVNPETGNVSLLLHNYAISHVDVLLNFDANWVRPTSANATCMFLDSSGIPVFIENSILEITDNTVKLKPESSCFFTFQTGYNFHTAHIVKEHTLYSDDIVIPITSSSIQTTISANSIGEMSSAILRLGISNANKTVQVAPTRITVNHEQLDTKNMFTLYGKDEPDAETQWKVFNYEIPVSFLTPNDNTIILDFAQSGGYVSSVALLIGETMVNNI